MGSVRISVGTEWLADGRVWRVMRQPQPGTLIALEHRSATESEFQLDEVLRDFASGKLRLVTIASEGSTTPRSETQDIRDLPAEQRQIVEQRWSMIEPLTAMERSPTNTDFEARATQLRQEGINTSRASLRRYYSAWQLAGGDPSALIPRLRQCGGRGRSRTIAGDRGRARIGAGPVFRPHRRHPTKGIGRTPNRWRPR